MPVDKVFMRNLDEFYMGQSPVSEASSCPNTCTPVLIFQFCSTGMDVNFNVW